MRNRAIRWRLAVLPLVALALVPACDEAATPSCAKAVELTFERCWVFVYGFPPYGSGDLMDDPEGALAYCEETLTNAEATGCEAAHDRFRSCLGSRRQCDDGRFRELCDREEAALHACLAGQVSFELNCGNGKDDDGDGLTDCWDPDCVNAGACGCFPCLSIPQSADRAVDLLYVIDNSGSMADEQTMLWDHFRALSMELRRFTYGLPDVHLGVTSTDLGVGGYPLLYCEDEGDQGRLLTHNCTNPTGAPYIVDVAPRSCDIETTPPGTCTSHSCSQANCAFEPSTTLSEDSATGCPRCRNYSGEELEDAFSCIVELGTQGCGFEQTLEAMRLALDDNPANQEFLREEAALGVLFITNEDDCSASDTGLFDGSATSIDSPLGPRTSFRCFEFGVTCDDDSRTSVGLRENCMPRSDPDAMLYPISRYVDFLESLKDPQLLVVAAIAGPVVNQSVTVGRDEYDQPELKPSCSTERGGAVPGIRMKALVEAFNIQEDLPWAYGSVCVPVYTDTLQWMGRKIVDILDFQCLPAPLRGCTDVGAEYGAAVDSCDANDLCQATCNVTDVLARGTPEEEQRWVPPCLEICEGGPCPGNTDRDLAYANGHPEERDTDLPVEACWHIRYAESCPQSNYAQITVARRADPPPRTFSLVGCMAISQTEELCSDGVDNDEDCLVDMDDPDCQGW